MRVLVAGDDPLARAGLAALLATQPRIEVVAQVASPDGAGFAGLPSPEVVVWDLGAGEVASLERSESLPVVALVADEHQAAEALAAGARAVLLRNADGARIAAAVVAVAHGLLVLDDSVAEPPRRRAPSAPLPESLTAREGEVLRLLSQGLANRRIAEALGIGERTVKFHVNAILGKLGAQSRTEAVVLAVRLGLVAL